MICGDGAYYRKVWHADHIVPLWSVDRSVDEAWKYWTLENLQTLCWECHAEKTALEARDRASFPVIVESDAAKIDVTKMTKQEIEVRIAECFDILGTRKIRILSKDVDLLIRTQMRSRYGHKKITKKSLERLNQLIPLILEFGNSYE